MKMSFLYIVLPATLLSCAHGTERKLEDIIDNFSEVRNNINRDVRIVGFISHTHGAAGLYFKLTDLDQANEKCILPNKFNEFPHGERVSMVGKLKRTDCASDKICLNVCDDYELIRSQ